MAAKGMKNKMDETVSLNIRKARLASGLSQTALSHSCGVTYQQLQKYENGSNRVSCGRLHEISIATGKPIEWFFK